MSFSRDVNVLLYASDAGTPVGKLSLLEVRDPLTP